MDNGVVQTLVIFALVVLIVLVWTWRDEKRFREAWPPISDDEFVALCKPGTSREVALRVRRIIAEQLGVDYDRVHPGQSFVNDLDCC